LPAVFTYIISANLRLLFPEKLDRDLPIQSYTEFAKHLHCKLYWWARIGENEQGKWNPQLVSHFVEALADPPYRNFYFEASLNAGCADLVKQITQVELHYHVADTLNWATVKKVQIFLDEHHYLVKGTTKISEFQYLLLHGTKKNA
jgi:hypothetical protein